MITWNYVEPIRNGMSIEEFEADFDVVLPAAYKTAARTFNNGYPSHNVFRLPDGEQCRMKHLYSFNREDRENMWKRNTAETLAEGYLAFANDAFGNQIGFRLTDFAVIFADYDTGEILEIAPDFQTFLTSLTRLDADR